MIKKYKSKPKIIEAIEWKGNLRSYKAICTFIGDLDTNISFTYGVQSKFPTVIHIPTLEGIMKAEKGCYIVKGIQGEFYPVKPDIFEATYEEISGD